MARVISSSRLRQPRFYSSQSSVAQQNFNTTTSGIAALRRAISRSPLRTLKSRQRFAQRLASGLLHNRPCFPSIRRAVITAAEQIVEREFAPFFNLPAVPQSDDPLAAYETRNEVDRRLDYFDHEDEHMTRFKHQLRSVLQIIIRAYQESNQVVGALTITTPAHAIADDPTALIDEITRQISKLASDPNNPARRPGAALGDIVIQNLLAASRLTYEEAQKRPYRIARPAESNLTPPELIRTYLSGTPFETILTTEVELTLPDDLLPESGLVTALPGHGKTQQLQSMVLRHLNSPAQPSIVVMDSQGDCLRVLSHLKRFDRTVGNCITIIDPTDPWPPALNLFSWNRELAASLSEMQREEMLAGVIETFKFTCEGLFGTGLTPRMQLVFQYLALWIIQIPGASLHTLINLLRDPTPYLQYTLDLSPTAQGFIEDLFAARSPYRETCQHILSRLHAVVGNPLFERMFAHPENKFDIGSAMNTPGHVTLINTAKAQLKSECSALFGRFWIARIYQATMARAFIPSQQRRLSVILIDEAHEYLHGAESTLEELLFQARKYRVSINLFHQTLDQFRKAGVLGATLGVPALRFTGAISDSDANLLAKEMNTTPEFLKSMRKTTRSAEWAVFARNITQTATKTTLPFLEAERQPKMSPEAYRQLRQRNRQRVGAPRQAHQAQTRSNRPTNNDGDSY